MRAKSISDVSYQLFWTWSSSFSKRLCTLQTTSFTRQNLIHIVFCKVLRNTNIFCMCHHIFNPTLNHQCSDSLWKNSFRSARGREVFPLDAHMQRSFVLSLLTLKSAVSKSCTITWGAALVILEGTFSLFVYYISQWYLPPIVLQAIAMTFWFSFIYLSQKDLSRIFWQVRTINNRFPVILKSQ